ncbi:hypothetical protein VNI00_018745, partial [Paramarasmius palmivorus]
KNDLYALKQLVAKRQEAFGLPVFPCTPPSNVQASNNANLVNIQHNLKQGQTVHVQSFQSIHESHSTPLRGHLRHDLSDPQRTVYVPRVQFIPMHKHHSVPLQERLRHDLSDHQQTVQIPSAQSIPMNASCSAPLRERPRHDLSDQRAPSHGTYARQRDGQSTPLRHKSTLRREGQPGPLRERPPTRARSLYGQRHVQRGIYTSQQANGVGRQGQPAHSQQQFSLPRQRRPKREYQLTSERKRQPTQESRKTRQQGVQLEPSFGWFKKLRKSVYTRMANLFRPSRR